MTRFSRQQSYVSLTALEMIFLTGVLSFLDSAQGSSPSSTVSSIKTTMSQNTTALQTHNFSVMIEFINISWQTELLDKRSPGFIALENKTTQAVEKVIRENISAVVDVEVKEFKPGSVLAFLTIETNTTEEAVKEILKSQISDGELNGLDVSKTLFSGTLFDVVIKIRDTCNDSKELKDLKHGQNLTNTVQQVLPGNDTATIQRVLCPIPNNITMVTIRIQIRNATSMNPNLELKSLRKIVESGQLGNFSLVPGWQAYIPGEKQFFVSFDMKTPSENKTQTIKELQEGIQALLGKRSYLRYFSVALKNNNTTAVVEIGMKTIASDQPNEALKPLKESVLAKKVRNIKVIAQSYEAYINPNTLTQRVFEVHFRVNMSNCTLGDIGHNHFARMAVQDYIADYIKKFEQRDLFVGDELRSLKCVNGNLLPKERFAQAVYWVYLKPETPDLHKQYIFNLYKCKTEIGVKDWGVKVVSLTPTSSPVKLYTHYVCGWRPKPTATSTVLTMEPSSSGNPAIELNPNLFIETRLGMTWKEFCSKLEHSLKQRVAWSLYDKNGTGVSPDRIIFMNVKTNCDDPSKKNEQTEVWFYVSKSGSKELDEWLTLKAYRVLQMLLENGNAKQLGPEFEGKVIHVDLAGESSSKHKSLFDSGKLSTLAIILIAIAGAVGLVLLIVACCCVYCHGAKRRKKAKGEDSQALHVVHVTTNSFTDGITKKRQEEEKKENSLDHTCTGDESKTNSENTKAENDNLGDNVQENERVISYENQAYAGQVPEKDDGEQNSNNEQACVVAPTIVTSPAPAEYENMDTIMNVNTVGQFPDTASSGSGGSRRGSGQGRGSKPPSPAALQRINADPGRRRSSAHSVIDDEDVPLTHKTGTVGIVALALRNKNERKKEAEFKNLSKDVPEEEVKYPENTQNKNRSPDVLPAPKTRVKLSSDPDYINANWIRDHKGQRRYIATQHPLQETAEDFWRMVWEQGSRLIVMVNEEEREKPNAFMDYLPRGDGNAKAFGGIHVTVKQITQKSDYTLTTLRIANNKKTSSATREVSHMRFTSWKGRAMPNVALFVGFVTAAREERKRFGDAKSPTIVHCRSACEELHCLLSQEDSSLSSVEWCFYLINSDGLGFTGVYIALDIGIGSHEESKTSVVDVFELSKNLRNDRHGIVCSLDHYNFIYQALYEYTVNYDESAEAQKR